MYLDIWANTFGQTAYPYGSCGCTQHQYLGLDLNCHECAPNCVTCNDGTGACNACTRGFQLLANGTCACAPNQNLVGGLCVAVASCAPG